MVMTDVSAAVAWLEQDYDRKADDEDNWPLYTRTFIELIEDTPPWTGERMMHWRPLDDASHLGPEYPTALAPASA